MLLNPRQFEAFRLVMLRGSVTGAALALKISQPAVSRLIRDLEVRSGIKLFERRGNHLLPTPEASLLLTEVERYAYGIQAISTFAEDLHKRRRGMLRVVALPAMAMGFLPRFVASFIKGRSLESVHVHGMPSHLVIEAVAAGQAEIGLAANPTRAAGPQARAAQLAGRPGRAEGTSPGAAWLGRGQGPGRREIHLVGGALDLHRQGRDDVCRRAAQDHGHDAALGDRLQSRGGRDGHRHRRSVLGVGTSRSGRGGPTLRATHRRADRGRHLGASPALGGVAGIHRGLSRARRCHGPAHARAASESIVQRRLSLMLSDRQAQVRPNAPKNVYVLMINPQTGWRTGELYPDTWNRILTGRSVGIPMRRPYSAPSPPSDPFRNSRL